MINRDDTSEVVGPARLGKYFFSASENIFLVVKGLTKGGGVIFFDMQNVSTKILIFFTPNTFVYPPLYPLITFLV